MATEQEEDKDAEEQKIEQNGGGEEKKEYHNLDQAPSSLLQKQNNNNDKKTITKEQQQHNDEGDIESDETVIDDDYDDDDDDEIENGGEEGEDALEDERTWLDIFGELAKEILTQHVIPPTNAECRWDWRSARCEPYCNCAFHPQWGDYHLGRSCRFRFDQKEMEDELIKNEIEVTMEGIQKLKEEKWDGIDMCNVPPDTKYARTVREILKTKKDVSEIVQMKAKELYRKADVKGKVVKARENMCDALLPEDGDDDFYNTAVEGEETKRKKLHRLLCDQEHQDRWVKMKVESEMLENDFFVNGGIGRRYLH